MARIASMTESEARLTMVSLQDNRSKSGVRLGYAEPLSVLGSTFFDDLDKEDQEIDPIRELMDEETGRGKSCGTWNRRQSLEEQDLDEEVVWN